MPSPSPSQVDITTSSQPELHQQAALLDESTETERSLIGNGEQHNGNTIETQPADSIQEGKQKAKAVMAASGLALGPIASGGAVMGKNGATKTDDLVPNGAVQSRKRSRSGTRKGHTLDTQSLPRRTKEITDNVLLEQYVNRDMMHAAATKYDDQQHMNLQTGKRIEKEKYMSKDFQRMRRAGEVFGPGYQGWGNSTANISTGGSHVFYPIQRRRPGGRRARELRVPKKDLLTQSEQLDELVPIRLDIEWEKIRLRDTFTWNLHDRVVTPELFAEQLVEDFKLPLEHCGPLLRGVVKSIREQIEDFHPHVFIDEEALDPHLPYLAYKDDEMRITIKLNITIGQNTLVDQFEWEINNPLDAAEDFARQMTRDLSLPGEFTTAIAHSIREQSQLFTRSLYVTGHPFDGRPVEDQELKSSFLPSPLPSSFRPYQAAKEFTPYLYELNEVELEKTELSLSREERRQKRSVNRRGGPALPDLKDRRRTIRTLVVSSVLPGAAATIEDSRILKRTATASGRGKRPGHGHKDGIDDSDESESDDSDVDSPTIPAHLVASTARTRGMRGAASVVQAAMRGNLERSATPESSTLHHHETRTSGRRFGGKDYREESVDDSPTYIIKLRIPRERYKQLLRDLKSKSRPEPLQSANSSSHLYSRRSQSVDQGQGTPAHGSMGPPPTTPGAQPQPSPRNHDRTASGTTGTPSVPIQSIHPHAAQIGRVDAVGPPSAENPIVSSSFHPYTHTILRTNLSSWQLLKSITALRRNFLRPGEPTHSSWFYVNHPHLADTKDCMTSHSSLPSPFSFPHASSPTKANFPPQLAPTPAMAHQRSRPSPTKLSE